jgi:two-component system LytT family response regulator
MSIVKAVIADADELGRGRLRALLARRADIQVVAECSDGFEAASTIARLRPQVAFLGMQLEGLDGLGVCGQLGESRPEIVIVGSSSADAVRAYELPAIDFLLKPFSDYRLQIAVDRVREAIAKRFPGISADEVRSLFRELRGGRPEHLAVRAQGTVKLLPLGEISWIEAENKNVRIHARRRSHVIRASLTDLEEKLPRDRFKRVHREAIVNLTTVQEITPWQRADFRIVLYDGSIVPLGRRYRKDFEASLLIERLKYDS